MKYLKKKRAALIKSKSEIMLKQALNYTYRPQCCNKISLVNWSACYPMIYFFKMKIKFQFFLKRHQKYTTHIKTLFIMINAIGFLELNT